MLWCFKDIRIQYELDNTFLIRLGQSTCATFDNTFVVDWTKRQLETLLVRVG